jgi:hypothetical protein
VYRFALFMWFNLDFQAKKSRSSSLRMKREVRGSILESCSLASFFWMLFISIIKILSILWIKILRHISFFKLTSVYLEYILQKEIPRYKLNRNSTEVSEG